MDINKEKVWQWIDSHWTAPRNCPICESSDWLLLERVWELGEFDEGAVMSGRSRLPVVALMCNVCGYQIFFNAVAVGAVRRPGPEE